MISEMGFIEQSFPISNSRVLSSDSQEQTQLQGLPKPNLGLRYLHLFESVRLSTKLSSEDQLFTRVVEKMLADWITQENLSSFELASGTESTVPLGHNRKVNQRV